MPLKTLILLLILVLTPLLSFADSEQTRLEALTIEAISVLEENLKAPDSAVLYKLLDEAVGIAIFPRLKKGGYLLGGHFGRGIVLHRDSVSLKWSSPVFYKIWGGSIGMQAGYSEVDLILIYRNEDSFSALLDKKVQMGVDLSASAGPLGRNVSREGSFKELAPIVSYSRSKGLFVGLSFSGAKLSYDYEGTKFAYKGAYNPEMILIRNEQQSEPAYFTRVREYLNGLY